MANPITKIKHIEISEQEQQEMNLSEILDVVSENKVAVLKGIDLLTTLHESGALEILDALVKQKDEALKNVVEQANKPTYAAILENLSDLLLMTGELPVDELSHFMKKISQGLNEARTAEKEQNVSYTGFIKALKDPEINRSLTIMLGFLRGMGRE